MTGQAISAVITGRIPSGFSRCQKLSPIQINHSLFDTTKNADKGILTYDRVHLNDAGNQLVADAVWEAIK